MLIFTEVYGIGAKKAEELVKTHKVTTIEELRARQDELLNDKQKIGLKHYEDILKRIPRKEILQYEKELKKIFNKVKNKNSTFQIVGSFRRGKSDSGDIDICVSDPDDNVEVFNRFLDALIEKKILIEVLSRGNVKSLGVSRLRRKPARRIDFMFTPRKELAFALLYFTGSKTFNTVMRKRALDLGYSMNEHGLYKMEKAGKSFKKGKKLDKYFPEEEDVFNFLGMVYKDPTERIDGTSVVLLKDQLQDEIQGCLGLVKLVFSVLGMNEYRVRVSLRDPDSDKYVGDADGWNKAEAALKQAVRTLDVDYEEELGEAAFYGPKIDFVVKDVIGREWQLGTVQVDYNLPERFDISYVGADNKDHRPVMIHRAPFGSMERFCGLLIEHFAGNFPTWLAPEQVRILPMNDDLVTAAEQCAKEFSKVGIRTGIDRQAAKLGAKIRKAENEKIPHMVILGKREAEEGKVTIRSRNNPELDGTCDLEACVEQISTEIKTKALPKKRHSENSN